MTPQLPDIPDNEYRRLEQSIASADSPVGIDAKKTHVLILHKLMRIEERLDALERMVKERG